MMATDLNFFAFGAAAAALFGSANGTRGSSHQLLDGLDILGHAVRKNLDTGLGDHDIVLDCAC